MIQINHTLASFADLKNAMDKYCSSHEDVLEWLLEAEDRLHAMQKVSEGLDEIKVQFQVNSEYMAYLDTNQEAVGKVCTESWPHGVNSLKS